MTRSKWFAAGFLIVGVLVSFATPAHAVTNYGSSAADSALQFNPFAPGATSDGKVEPVIVPRAAGVSAPSILAPARTPVNPPKPILDVVDAPRVFEGPYLSGLKASFVVTLHPTTKKTVTVQYRTFNGTGRAGIEYASKSGTLTFAPGRFAQIVLVDVLNDDLKVKTNVPGPRTFFLEIFNPTNAKIGRKKGEAEIAENGSLKEGITVTNALPVYETGSNIKAVFTVSLNRPSSNTVKVDFKTANGTAMAPSDYKSVSGTLTFLPGQTMKMVSVTVFDNPGPKNEQIVESFQLQLSNPTNAILLRTHATAEIVEFKNSNN